MRVHCARIVSIIAACVAGWTWSAFGTTYYADFHGTKSLYAYDWFNVDNWRVMNAEDQLVQPSQVPQEGDDVIVNAGCGQMSAFPDGATMNPLNSMTFNVAPSSSIHQGYIGFLANGVGLKVMDNVNVSTWAGLAVKGTGDFVVDIGAGGSYNNQKCVELYSGSSNITLIKKGSGTFHPVYEGSTTYKPVRTILMGGTFQANGASPASGHEFVFGSNDGGLRLKLATNSQTGSVLDFKLPNGALVESNEVDNTTHGITATDSTSGFYVRLTGTPKLAEQRFTGSLYASAGIAFCPDAKQAGGADYVFTIAKAVNPVDQGRLVVTNGTLRLTEGASFLRLQKLNVGPTGTFKIESGSGAAAFASELDVAAGGKLNLAAGVTLTAYETKIGGEKMAVGTYTTSNCSAIDGEGTLVVTPYSTINPIILDVADETFIEGALTAYNTANNESVSIATLNGGVDKDRPLVKRGAGLLKMDKPMSNYGASVFVEGGALRTEVRYSIGKESNDLAPVYVRAGATFTSLTTNTVMNANRIFHIAGNGNGTYGAALHCYGNGVPNNYGNTGCLGKTVILDADATGHVESWMFLGSSRLELNGHTLTFLLQGSENTDRPGHLPSTIVGPGEIVVKGGQWRFGGTTTFQGTGKVTFNGEGGMRFTGLENHFAGTYKNWLFQFDGPTRNIFYGDYNIDPRDANHNNLNIPVVVNAPIALWNQGDRNRNYLLVKTPISGTGRFATGTSSYTSFLHLLDPNQTYTGGITFNRGVIWVYPDGAIPAGEGTGAVTLTPTQTPLKTTNSGGFTNTFNGVAFMCPVTYHLPDLVMQGSKSARVQNGQGTWKTVTQNGTGDLEYFSSLGADTLDVKKGTVKFGRGMMAGLWEGTNIYASAAAATAAYGTSVCFTNLAVRGPTSAICEPGHNYTSWKTNEVITYTGYIWNRGSDTVTWSLASALTGSVTVKVDGQEVLSGTNQILHGNVTLVPGPHAFVYRACCANTTAAAAPITTGWAGRLGFAIDFQGRNTANAADYVMGVDTGDGALFTRTVEGGMPQFGEMKFAKGTTLDLNGNAYTASVVRGFPSVTNTAADASAAASLTITNQFVVLGEDIDVSAPGRLTTVLPLSFGSTGSVLATNLAELAHGKYTIAETTGNSAIDFGGAAPTRQRLKTDSKGWVIFLSDDGKSLSLEYSAGTLVMFH